MKAEVQLITPEKAKKILEKNIGNRTVRQSTVRAYAKDMKNGNWQENGEPIQISKDGRLLNGQHRLKAIIMSGTSQKMIVISDVDNAVTVYDQMAKRTDRDILKYAGYDIWVTQNNMIGGVRQLINMKTYSTERISTPEIEDFIVRHEITLKRVYDIFCGIKKNSGVNMRNAQIIASIFIALKNGVEWETVNRFIYVVSKGMADGMEESSAIIIRNMIITKQLNNGSMPEKLHYIKQVLKAIKDFDEGKERTRKYNEKELCYRLNY